MMAEYVQVFTTINDRKKAEDIAESVVVKRLAACVQITGPVTSVYRWEGKVNKEEEWLLIIKSSKELYGKLEKEIKEIHPYDVPEILVMPVLDGNRDYLEWLRNEIAIKQHSDSQK